MPLYGNTLALASNETVVGENGEKLKIFIPINRYISATIEDVRSIHSVVTMEN